VSRRIHLICPWRNLAVVAVQKLGILLMRMELSNLLD
jgi:hypothetical protein